MRHCWNCAGSFPAEVQETRPGSGECVNCQASQKRPMQKPIILLWAAKDPAHRKKVAKIMAA